jgi:hypothetical protein
VPHAEALMGVIPLSHTNYSYRKSGKFATSERRATDRGARITHN